MPGARARRLCPDLLFVKPRFDVYRAVSAQVRDIFSRFTDIIQPLSLDEAYLDVTVNKAGSASATRIAQDIRALIRAETGLTASAGVSYNKLIAKLASDQNKPDGICVVRPGEGAAFIAAMPVRRIHGVGPVTARRMQALGIETGADLRARDIAFLQAHFGSAADFYYRAARGEDDRPVRERQSRKSVSVEDTFFDDLTDRDALVAELDRIAASLWTRIEKAQAWGRTVVLKVKFADFRILTRSRSFAAPVRAPAQLAQAGRELLLAQLPLPMGARLLGLGVLNLEGEEDAARGAQLALAL